MTELTQEYKEQLKKETLDQLRDYIDKFCIFRANPQVQYFEDLDCGKIHGTVPGRQNTWQIFMRRATHDYLCLFKISTLFYIDMIEKVSANELKHFQFCGLETGSLPLMAGLQMRFASDRIGVNAFSVRKKRKPYGIFNFIEGVPTEAPVIFIDDIFNSGKTALRAAETVGYELNIPFADYVYCVVNLSGSDELEYYPGQKMKIISLFKKEDFNFDFDEGKYWEPKDIDKSYNKRTDYR